MADLSHFPITKKWPAANPDIHQYYGLPTPNGVKVTIMLEELGVPYEAHLVDFASNDQLSAVEKPSLTSCRKNLPSGSRNAMAWSIAGLLPAGYAPMLIKSWACLCVASTSRSQPAVT